MQTTEEKKKLTLFDSHAHYYDEQFSVNGDDDTFFLLDTLKRARINVLVPGIDMETSRKAIEYAEKFDHVYAAVGIHPHECGKAQEDAIEQLAELVKHERVKAIGEIGLDYFYNFAPKAKQQEWFYKQLELARKLDVPVIIHDREAHGDITTALNMYSVRGVLHCFSGSAEMARQLVDKGWYISFSGSITFRNASKICEAVKAVPMDRILCETDAPYMAPIPFRGQRNDSRLMIKVVEKIAELKEKTVAEVAQATYENTCRVFDIEQ